MVSIFHLLYLLCFEIAVSRLSSECWEQMSRWLLNGYIVNVSAIHCKCPAHTKLSFRRRFVQRRVKWKETNYTSPQTKERERSTVAPWGWICLTWQMIQSSAGSYMSSMFRAFGYSSGKKVLVFSTLGPVSRGVISCVQNLSTCPPVDGAGVLRLCLSVSSASP